MTKVLVVDDTPDMVRLIARAVEDEGYEALKASSGREALEVAAAERLDAILLDVMMPQMTGIEVLSRLKADSQLRDIPVILVTAKGEDADVIEGLDGGAHDYVAKPFKKAILAARLRSAVRLKQDHDALTLVNEQLQAEIAERKRKEQELVQAQKLESIGQLAAGIAHEINTPSQYIGDNIRFLQEAFQDIDTLLEAFARLLEGAKNHTLTDDLIAQVEAAVREADIEYLTHETPKAIRQSLEGVDKVAIIVRAMKEFSHPGGNEKQAVDLNRAIESTLTVSRNEWKYVADLVTDFDRNLPLVPCFPSEFNQVILNLIVNAAQAIGELAGDDSKEKETITVSTRLDGDWVDIRVQDTGTGIPEEIRSKVFDHFFTTKEVGKGTGQGLTIAHTIITEKHGGTITFETETGRGTTFIVRLPIAESPASEGDVRSDEVYESGDVPDAGPGGSRSVDTRTHHH